MNIPEIKVKVRPEDIELCGYDLDSLFKISLLLKEEGITPSDLKVCANNVSRAVDIAFNILQGEMERSLNDVMNCFQESCKTANRLKTISDVRDSVK